MAAPNTITADKLYRLIGTPGAPVPIDIRPSGQERRIPASIVRPAEGVAEWSRALAGRAVVIVDDDAAGAHGVAAWLRSAGVEAETLDAGYAGWVSAGLPSIDLRHAPRPGADGRTAWVTRARPKVDRVACPWLIRRFVDPDARFLFVPPGEVLAVADRIGATPFDVDGEGVHWSHRGELCTFDVMIEAFGLDAIEPLRHLAMIVRGADTARPDLVPEAAGLLAVSLGLSRLYADDLAQLDAGMPVYDALYRWCRDARGETHDWTSHTARSKVHA